jgi:hypothetical protein
MRDGTEGERKVSVQPEEVLGELGSGELDGHERRGKEHPEKRLVVGGEARSHGAKREALNQRNVGPFLAGNGGSGKLAPPRHSVFAINTGRSRA